MPSARVGRPGVVPDLAAAIQRGGLSDEARAHAVRALGKIAHRSANPALAAAMGDGSAEVRREAVESWNRILRQADAAPVVALVTDTDVSVRRAATQVVGRFPVAAARAALEGLVASDPDPAVRRNAAWALGRIGDAASRSVLGAASADAVVPGPHDRARRAPATALTSAPERAVGEVVSTRRGGR